MNIYVTSSDPDKCARVLDDDRLSQSITDVGTILANVAHRVYGQQKLFREYFPNHPINQWLRRSDKNFIWTSQYYFSLMDEHEWRFIEPSKSQYIMECIFASLRTVKKHWINGDVTPEGFVNSAKNTHFSYADKEDVFEAYKLYLDHCWKLNGGKWTRRKRPNWREN